MLATFFLSSFIPFSLTRQKFCFLTCRFLQTDPWPDAETLLADLQKDNCTIKREKVWKQVEKVLQNLAGQKDFRGLIAFLQVNEYQSSVVSHLENLLLDLRKRCALFLLEE